MQLTINTSDLDPNALGRLLMILLRSTGVDPEKWTYILGMGWCIPESIDHRYLPVLMGDEANRPKAEERVFSLRYKEELTVLVSFDGDMSILFYTEGEDGFAINNIGSSLNRWEAVQL